MLRYNDLDDEEKEAIEEDDETIYNNKNMPVYDIEGNLLNYEEE